MTTPMWQIDLAVTPIAAALRTGWITVAVAATRCSSRAVAGKPILGPAIVRVQGAAACNDQAEETGQAPAAAARKGLAQGKNLAEGNGRPQNRAAEGSAQLHGLPAVADERATPSRVPEAVEVPAWRPRAATRAWAVVAAARVWAAVAAVREQEAVVVHAVVAVVAAVAAVVAAAEGPISRSSTTSFFSAVSITVLASIASAITEATGPMLA
jgi:hypothetical protein